MRLGGVFLGRAYWSSRLWLTTLSSLQGIEVLPHPPQPSPTPATAASSSLALPSLSAIFCAAPFMHLSTSPSHIYSPKWLYKLLCAQTALRANTYRNKSWSDSSFLKHHIYWAVAEILSSCCPESGWSCNWRGHLWVGSQRAPGLYTPL